MEFTVTRYDDHKGHARIENSVYDRDTENWHDTYVEFSGYFGADGPELYAAAPAMRDALRFILTCDREQVMGEGMDRVRAALALARGEK